MIDHLDNLLRHLFMTQLTHLRPVPPAPVTDDQVRFQSPHEHWRTFISNLTVDGQPVNALNAYLVNLRENHKLRSNAQVCIGGSTN